MIAIQSLMGSFTDQWEVYCRKNAIVYINIDIFDTDVFVGIQENKIDKILFAVTLYDNKTRIAALSIVRSIEALGVDVFPGSAEFWHFDDKIAQKYLFESLAIPHCPTAIFYDRNYARGWVKSATYPKIFKLKCGAGSTNVIMVKSSAQAERLVDQMFGKGMLSVPTLFSDLSTKLYKHKKKRDLLATLKRIPSTIRNIRNIRNIVPREHGYVYFQDFMPDNTFDTRVTIIGDKAFAFRRMVRKNDFRASGSGNIDYDTQYINLDFVVLAFDATDRMGSRCMAFDLIYDRSGAGVIVECCYGFVPDAVFCCPGYWDRSLRFYPGHCNPQELIIKGFLTG